MVCSTTQKQYKESVSLRVRPLKDIVAMGELLFFAINVNDYVMKFKFDNVCGCRHPRNDGIMGVIDVMIGEKLSLSVFLVPVCSFPHVTPSVLAGVHRGFPGGSQKRRV